MASIETKTIEILKPKVVEKIEIKATRKLNNYLLPVKDIVKESEGCRLIPYQCPSQTKTGIGWTVGYGRVIKDGEDYLLKGINQYQADSLLINDLELHYKIIAKEFDSLTLNQKLALTSFIYAVGTGNFKDKSNLYKKLKLNEEILEEDFTNWSGGYERNKYFRKLDYLLFKKQ